jgi:hypothetical protein
LYTISLKFKFAAYIEQVLVSFQWNSISGFEIVIEAFFFFLQSSFSYIIIATDIFIITITTTVITVVCFPCYEKSELGL